MPDILTAEQDFDTAFAAATFESASAAEPTTPTPAVEPATPAPTPAASVAEPAPAPTPAPAVAPAAPTPAPTPEPAAPTPSPAPEPTAPVPAATPAAPTAPAAPTTPAATPAAEPTPTAAPVAELTDEEYEARLLKQIPDPVLADDKAATLAKFKEDWSDIAAAMEVQQAHTVSQIEARVARMVASVVRSIYADMAPMAGSFANVEAGTFRQAVLGKHNDYDEVFPKLEPWIKSHPLYLQSGMMDAYNSGSAADVIDLVGRYKAAAGVMPQVLEPAKPNVTAAAKAAELAPVQAQRTAPKPAGEDPNDFDSAFAQAAAQFK